MANWLTRERLTGSTAVLVYLAAFKFGLHVFSNVFFPYGYFRDEFYYMACAQNLAWGYVDHPPLIAVIGLIERTLFGDSPLAWRILPAQAGAGMVFVTGIMARRLGGNRFAQVLAAVAVIFAPVYLAVDNMLTTVAFDHLWWALTAYFVLVRIQSGDARWWLAIGATVGLGLMTKHNMLFLAVGLAVGVLLSLRADLKTRWLWFGAGLAFLIVLPNLIWQAQNDFATLEFIRNASGKNADASPVQYLVDQILALNPITLPLWVLGAVTLARSPSYRALFWMYLIPFLIFGATMAARTDYITPAYTWLFAAGAAAFGKFLDGRAWNWAKPIAVGAVVLVGAPLLPVGLPVMPPAQLADYVTTLGIANKQVEDNKVSVLPQYLADRFGWQEMAAAIGKAYAALPAQDRANALIFTANYGEAGALNFYGKEYGLPRAISGHNNYFLWGPGQAHANTVIIIGFRDKDDFADVFTSVEQVGMITCEFCPSDENNLPIWVARGPKLPLPDVWENVKHYG